MSKPITIVEYCGPQNNSECGYCRKTDTCNMHGMWAHCMSVHDYQDLIDRGWRRSGQYCYKPNNKETCCPSYTIKCAATEFRLSKSHKKVLKKFNAFLRNGVQPTESNQHEEENCADSDKANAEDSSALMESAMIDNNQPAVEFDVANVMKTIEMDDLNCSPGALQSNTAQYSIRTAAGPSVSETQKKGENNSKTSVIGPDPTKPLRQKAKFLRAQRKLEKQKQKSASNDAINSENTATDAAPVKANKNQEQTLQSLVNATPVDGVHKLKMKLVLSEKAGSDAELELYRRYQIGIHKDPPEKVTRKSFENFLIRSPLQHEQPHDGPSPGYGSFHQQYWFDNELIAVGVIDILPKCVSSVYFFYDPKYSFLTLGTYGTLRELLFVQELNRTVNSLSEYYMGFYIHTCQKMRYKGRLYPSFLLCSEAYTWHLLNDELMNALDAAPYCRFNRDPFAIDPYRFNPVTDLDNIRLLVDYKQCMTYAQYKRLLDSTGENDEYRESTIEYGELVGKFLSRRMFLALPLE